jgi:hypothetical protein
LLGAIGRHWFLTLSSMAGPLNARDAAAVIEPEGRKDMAN